VIKTVSLNRTNRSKKIEVVASRFVELALMNLEEEGPGDLEVTVPGRSRLLEKFCGRTNWDHLHESYPAEVSYLVMEDCAKVILFGLTFVCLVDESNDICKVLRLFRSVDGDRGFYKPFVALDHAKTYLIYYESGVFSLTLEGAVVWHARLSHDDILVDQCEDELTFSNEHVSDGRPWKLNLADGSIVN